MRDVFKAAFKTDLSDIQIGIAEKRGGEFNPLFEQPFSGWHVELLFEIPFECGKASAAQFGILFQREIIAEIFIHGLQE